MALGSGLGASLGVKQETTYGTYVAPTRWTEFVSETLNYRKQTMTSAGLRAGGQVARAARRVITLTDGGGDVVVEVPTTGFGLYLAHALGGTPTLTVSGSGTIQNHTIGDQYGKSLTAQVGVPQIGGTVTPYSFLGCKIPKLSLACSTGGFLMSTITLDAYDVTSAQTLATPSYDATASVFNFLQGALYVGGAPTFSTTALTTGGTAVANVRDFSLDITNGMDVARNYFGSGGKKAEPIANVMRALSGSMTVDFTDTTLAAAHIADTSLSLVMTFTGPLISGSTYNTFQVAIPAIKLNGDLPQVGGPGLVTVTAPFDVLDNGTNLPLYVNYLSSDVAV